MTAALFSRGKGRRAATAACAVALGLIALSACDKPTPLATVTVGSTTVTAEAAHGCYNESEQLSKSALEKCLAKAPEKTIKVTTGEKVRIGVDPKIAESGWAVVAGTPVMNEPSKETYRSFDSETLLSQQNPQTGQPSPVDKVTLTVVQVDEEGKGSKRPKGLWRFKLERDS
ncbi:hypothetical protein [Streptomyces coffeae]|uniref:DUF2771 domain-containing protein n=1 Tax=Streptomyces coffeae TaxID=621382 RepID=A0ABS1N5R1_9ACTN|nr:hypothetical protein [Streptomyces coffeae]MBL1095353.1 hypothetical protein [Streptomyces coffeae]